MRGDGPQACRRHQQGPRRGDEGHGDPFRMQHGGGQGEETQEHAAPRDGDEALREMVKARPTVFIADDAAGGGRRSRSTVPPIANVGREEIREKHTAIQRAS